MGRAGILFSHVAKVAANLVADGKNPTVDNVREALGGTGSKSTIAPMLKRWKAEHTEDIAEAELGVPAELLHAIKGVYDKLQGDVQQQMAAADASHRAALQAVTEHTSQLSTANQVLSDTNGALSVELKHANDALARLQTEQQALNVTLATAQSDKAGLQQRLTDRAAEIAALNHQLVQSRVQFEHYQDSTARQRSEERQASEQRSARLEQDLASAQRQTAVQQSTIEQQEVHLTRLTEKNTRLQEAARTVQEQSITAKSECAQLSYQLQETASARRDLQVQLDTTQQALTEARMAQAGQAKETQLLTERLVHADKKMEKLEQDRLTLLTEKAELHALVAKRIEKEKKDDDPTFTGETTHDRL